jgi:hypothetical protein
LQPADLNQKKACVTTRSPLLVRGGFSMSYCEPDVCPSLQ